MKGEPVRHAVEGALIGLAWIGGLYAASPLIGGFGVVDAAQWIVLHSPGWLGALAVQTLGFYAKAAVIGGVTLAIVAACVVLRIGWSLLPPVDSLVPIGLGVLVTGVAILGSGAREPAGVLVGIAVATAPPIVVVWYLRRESVAPGRRSFLRRVGTVAASGVVSLGVLRVGFERVTAPDTADGDPGEQTPDARISDQEDGIPWRPQTRLPRDVSPPRGDPSFSFGRMPSAVTEPGDHYVVDINVDAPMVESTKPDIDAESWTLDVVGAVAEPHSLTFGDLLEHEASVGQTTTMVCISNRVGGDLIGTSHWTGVQLSDIVAEADPSDDAVNVVTHAADDYSEAIPIELVEREDILVAYGMGHRTLSRDHGFPARLLIPGRYGMKMTKWIERIELVDDEHTTHYEARGWDEEGIVNTMSYIRGFDRTDDRVTVGGVAFGGLETGVPEIDTVEVSVDGGDTWHDAELEHELDVHAWRRWKYEFESSERTRYEFVSRAVLRDGTVQTSEESGPRPGGATGWHRVTRDV